MRAIATTLVVLAVMLAAAGVACDGGGLFCVMAPTSYFGLVHLCVGLSLVILVAVVREPEPAPARATAQPLTYHIVPPGAHSAYVPLPGAAEIRRHISGRDCRANGQRGGDECPADDDLQRDILHDIDLPSPTPSARRGSDSSVYQGPTDYGFH